MQYTSKIGVDFLCKQDLEYSTHLGCFHKNKNKNVWVEFQGWEYPTRLGSIFQEWFSQDRLKAT